MARKSPVTGYVIYKGKSLINGDPIVVIAITKSDNSKTGNMLQTYIIPDNGCSPAQNAYLLKDKSVCGDCPHRKGLGGSCYVDLYKGINGVFKKYLRGGYPKLATVNVSEIGKDRMIRLGSYGDPAAVPRYVWDNLLKFAAGHTGYTHQWKNGKSSNIMDLVMASVDSEKDYETATNKGYRTFRVRLESEPVLKGEFICPASAEGNKKKHCVECKACDGGLNTRKGNPVIITHGILKGRHNKSNGLAGLAPDMGAFDFIKNPLLKLFSAFTSNI